jgi:hypothetical protein
VSKDSPDADTGFDWLELITILLLSFTAVLTAWSGFEAAKWGGEMSISFGQASAARLEASRLGATADRQRSLQTEVLAQWLEARVRGEQEVMDSLSARFKEPLKTAFAAWLKTKPLTNPNAPTSPMEMPEYVQPALEESLEAEEKANAKFQEGLDTNQIGDNYTLLTVLGAVILLFVAVSSRVRTRRSQWILLGVGLVLFTGILGLLIVFPKLV